MVEFEQSDLEKGTNYSLNTFNQNGKDYEEREKAFIKNNKRGIFSLVFVIILRGPMTEIFSVGLQTTDSKVGI